MSRYAVVALIVAVFVLDRLTKYLIVQELPYLQAVQVTPFFSIVHLHNTGGVFGLLSQHALAKYIFTLLPFLIMGVLVYMLLRRRLAPLKELGITAVLAGAVGNMYDRLMYGYVIDFLDFFYKNWHWPAFNVADSAITVGIGLWLYGELFPAKRLKEADGRGTAG